MDLQKKIHAYIISKLNYIIINRRDITKDYINNYIDTINNNSENRVKIPCEIYKELLLNFIKTTDTIAVTLIPILHTTKNQIIHRI